MHNSVLTLLLVVVLLVASIGAEATQYRITDLGTGAAFGINSLGQVVGRSGDDHAFVWQNGSLYDLGTNGGSSSCAAGINDGGQAVGSYTASGSWQAFLWQSGQGMLDIPMNGASAINNRGQVVGSNDEPGRAILWQLGSPTVTSFRYPDTSAAEECRAAAINEDGYAVGWARRRGGQDTAFVWKNEDLGMQSISNSFGGSQSQALGINNLGEVVGWATAADGTTHAFEWRENWSGMRDLGTGEAQDINTNGQVVGGNGRAVLWENGVARDLNNLIPANTGWTLAQAEAISENGQIVGSGIKGGLTEAFLLTPITLPEPSSVLALLCGIAGLGGMVWRRRQ